MRLSKVLTCWTRGVLLAGCILTASGNRALLLATQESSRYLHNGIHFYQTGYTEKARAYFIAVLSIGTPQEAALARRYLAALPKNPPRRRPRQVAPPPKPKSDSDQIIEDQELAPERTQENTSPDSDGPSRLRLSGSLREQAARRFRDPAQLSQLRTVGLVGGTGQWTEALSYKFGGRLWYDGVFDITHHYPAPVATDQRTNGELRDTYIDYSKNDWDVRLGKQQIVWGEAVGLFYADVVNAKDLREFVLPDFDFIRIPEWASDIEYQHGPFHGELVWLPWPLMDRVGRPGSEFAFGTSIPNTTPVQYGTEQLPDQSIENSEIGGRLSYRLNGWDLGVFHLRTWDKSPVYETTIDADGITLTATHPRLTINGATFAKEANGFVYKGEAVYYSGKYFQTTDPAVPLGITAKDYLDYLLGVDHSFGKLETSLQASQRYIKNYDSSLVQQTPLRTLMTVWIRHAFFDGLMEPEVLVIRDVNSRDLMARPKLTFKFASHWRFSLGMDYFDGPNDGVFGEFSHRSRATSELRYDF